MAAITWLGNINTGMAGIGLRERGREARARQVDVGVRENSGAMMKETALRQLPYDFVLTLKNAR